MASPTLKKDRALADKFIERTREQFDRSLLIVLCCEIAADRRSKFEYVQKVRTFRIGSTDSIKQSLHCRFGQK